MARLTVLVKFWQIPNTIRRSFLHSNCQISAHATPSASPPPKDYNTDLIPLNMEAKVALQAKASHN